MAWTRPEEMNPIIKDSGRKYDKKERDKKYGETSIVKSDKKSYTHKSKE
jgi:hypothetical protein